MTNRVGLLRRENFELLSLVSNLYWVPVKDITDLRGKDDYGTRRMLCRLETLGYVVSKNEKYFILNGKRSIIVYQRTLKGTDALINRR